MDSENHATPIRPLRNALNGTVGKSTLLTGRTSKLLGDKTNNTPIAKPKNLKHAETKLVSRFTVLKPAISTINRSRNMGSMVKPPPKKSNLSNPVQPDEIEYMAPSIPYNSSKKYIKNVIISSL